jgi:glyoxylase-like metal-dependent hydrolase (beta-lactamase superfamily II)
MTNTLSRRSFGQLLGAQAALGTTASLITGSASGKEGTAHNTSPPLGSHPLSRAALVATIANYFDWVHSSEYVDPYKSVQPTFLDVVLGTTPYARQIETALEEGIISGSEGFFYPNSLMTREDAAELFVRAFAIPLSTTDSLAGFTDAAAIHVNRRSSVNAMLAAGFIKGSGVAKFAPTRAITGLEARSILAAITTSRVAPPQVMCKPGTTAPRRYIRISTPTPGATIYYAVTFDGTEPADPTTAGQIYDFTADGTLQFVNPLASTTDSRFYRLKAVAKKAGMADSAVREFGWNIVRPQTGAFQAKLIQLGNSSTPTIWRINNPAEYFQANVYYIEGSKRGLVFDAGEYGYQKANLKDFIDTLATKPYDVMLGHNHPDHNEQIHNFTSAGVRLYVTAIEKAALMASTRADFKSAGTAAATIGDGEVLDLGNFQITAFHMPGHTNGLVTILINQTGWVYGSDMWGCNRAYTADTTQYQGVKVDLFLSLVQQLVANYQKSSSNGSIVQITNAHQEAPVGMQCVRNFLKCFQQLIDEGNGAAQPSIRGGTRGGDRMSMVGDMWRDRNWMSIGPIGKYASPVDYFSAPTTAFPCGANIDYNTTDGYRKYSVLSNIELDGGTLVGVDVYWNAPTNGVANKIANKFDPWTYDYTIKVPPGARSIVIKPVAMSNRVASMKLNGKAIRQAESNSVAVVTGGRITIEVVSPDRSSTSRYTLQVADM